MGWGTAAMMMGGIIVASTADIVSLNIGDPEICLDIAVSRVCSPGCLLAAISRASKQNSKQANQGLCDTDASSVGSKGLRVTANIMSKWSYRLMPNVRLSKR